MKLARYEWLTSDVLTGKFGDQPAGIRKSLKKALKEPGAISRIIAVWEAMKEDPQFALLLGNVGSDFRRLPVNQAIDRMMWADFLGMREVSKQIIESRRLRLSIEHRAIRSARVILAPDSSELVYSLEDSTFDVAHAEMQWDAAEVAFPKETGLSSVLIVKWEDRNAHTGEWLRCLERRLPGSILERIIAEGLHRTTPVTEIKYGIATSYSFDGPGIIVSASCLADCLGMIGNAPLVGDSPTDTLQEVRFRALAMRSVRAAAMLLVYSQVWPERIVFGLPSASPTFGIPHARAAEVRSGDGDQRFTSAHFRRGHFRTLLHERYERSRDGRPKIVWVRPHAVRGSNDAERVDPKTATNGVPLAPGGGHLGKA